MTRDQIQAVLREEYTRRPWLQVLREILPGTDVFASPQNVSVSVPNASPPVQLARVRLGDRKQLAVLEVKVSDRIDLLRNRVGLRNFVARFIDQAEYHGVLAVFLAPQSDFRFTFAARTVEFDADGNLVRRETAPRRYTYVLGPNESCRTAAERFLHLSEKGLSATMQDVIDAFSVEKLNKEFFADFSAAFERVKSEIEKRNKWKEKVAKEEAQTLLNRLLFLYFVQRKGWLNRKRDYLHSNFERFKDDAASKTTFLDGFLRPLFTKLSTEGSQADIPGHDLPFLNGGLFADEYGDEQRDEVARRHHELQVSNGVFQSVFDDLLERYNFTIQEDSPTNYEVAIDPEMLGQIFEELILTSEESETAGKSKRHDTGSHYTRRPIVHYLCRDSLAAWLESRPPFAGKQNASDRVRKLLALDATEGIDEETRTALKDILTPEEAAVLLDRLSDLRACDPAVGSGAFPMGLLHELVNLARLCATRAAGKDPVLGDRSWLYTTKKRIIERVIYGVDIQPQAVDICKLRLWLSLMVDYELSADPDDCEPASFRRALKEIEPLPNLDFKIRRANSLVDYIHGEPVELKRLSTETGAGLALSKLSTAKREFFNARTASAKRKLRLDIYDNITELAKIELTRARTDAAGLGIALNDRDAERVAELDTCLKEIVRTGALVRDARRMRAQAQEDALERIRTEFDDPEKPTFVWQFDFAEVFHRDETSRGESLLPAEKSGKSNGNGARNGFDLAIGNPPYVRIQTLTKSDPKLAAYYKQRYQSAAKGNYDLYVCFVERGLELLHQNGQLAFIQPHKFFNNQYGEPLRGLLSRNRHLRHIVHFGTHQIFPGATNYVCLLFLAKTPVDSCRFVRVENFQQWLQVLTAPEEIIPAKSLTSAEWNFAGESGSKLLAALKSAGVRLLDLPAEMSRGSSSGDDEVFVLENGSDIVESELLRIPVFATDFSKFSFAPNSKWRVIFPYRETQDGIELMAERELERRFPKGYRYLKTKKTELLKRKGARFWYGFTAPRNLDLHDKAQIVVPLLAEKGSFARVPQSLQGKLCPMASGGFTIMVHDSSPVSADYVLGLLNSPILFWILLRTSNSFRGGWITCTKQYFGELPIRVVSRHDQKERMAHDLVVRLVEWLSWLHEQPSVAKSTREHPVDPDIAAYIEQWLNALVYELYFPAELGAAGLRFFDLTAELNPPALESLPAAVNARLEQFRNLHKEWSAQGHPLRIALDKLRTLDLVRTIEGEA
jgi:adenine-specific DNA-methyltransferase